MRLVQALHGNVYRTKYGAIDLGLTITTVPIIHANFSRYIVSGIVMGAIEE